MKTIPFKSAVHWALLGARVFYRTRGGSTVKFERCGNAYAFLYPTFASRPRHQKTFLSPTAEETLRRAVTEPLNCGVERVVIIVLGTSTFRILNPESRTETKMKNIVSSPATQPSLPPVVAGQTYTRKGDHYIVSRSISGRLALVSLSTGDVSNVCSPGHSLDAYSLSVNGFTLVGPGTTISLTVQ